jgi:putative ABC transport system permease protein
MRRVPLAARNLFHDRRRASLSIAGVAASFLLVLVLDGVFNGAMLQVTSYIRHSPADLFVAQQGVTTMHMTNSALDPTVADAVAAVDGVAWVEGLRFTTSTLDAPDDSMLTYVFGYNTSQPVAGPRRIVDGTAPSRGGAVVDEIAADELGLAIGDNVTVLGASFRIDGLSTGGTYIANTTVFIRTDDFASLRGDNIAYLLVGIDTGADARTVRDAVAHAVPETTVMTKARFAHEEGNVVRSMAADVMLIMSAIGFVISLGVIGLTLFTATVAKQRDYGVLKAIGTSTGRLVAVLVGQAAITVMAGLALAVVAAAGLGRLITIVEPNVSVALTTASVVRTAAAGLLAAALAVVLPLRRIAHVDAATAFRRV